MAVFNKNALTQVSGFDNPIIAGELVYQQNTYWNLAITDEVGAPVDLAGAVIDAQIVRRKLSNVQDTRYGLTFNIEDYTPAPTPVPLSITNRVDALGQFTLLIDDTSWGIVASDPDMAINSANGAGYSGRIKISFSSPLQDDNIIFLLFIIRSDGIVKV